MENDLNKRNFLIEIIIFVLLVCTILHGCYDAVRYKDTGSGGGWDNYYAADVPIDVVIYGSSHAACTVNNAILWDEYGIPSFSMTAGGQTAYGTYEFMKESFKYQKPHVALIETFMLAEYGAETDAVYRTALTPRWSPHYASSIVQYAFKHNLGHETAEELALKMPIVHSRYAELERSDFINTTFYNMGYQGSMDVEAVAPPEMTDIRNELPEANRDYITDMIDLCRTNGVEPVFFLAPYSAPAGEIAYQNSIKDLITSYDVTYLDFVKENAAGIDYSTDMREYSHLNDTGASKVTHALADYLKTEYDLPDRREDSGYEAWDLHVRYQTDRRNEYTLDSCVDIGSYLDALAGMYGQYTVIISLNGDYRVLGDEPVCSALEALGIDKAAYEEGGVFLLRNGNLAYSSGGADEYDHYTELDHKIDLRLYRYPGIGFGYVRIAGESTNYDHNGVGIIVYDEQCMYTVDNVYTDVYTGWGIIR